jgi:hypothetical protein
MRNLAVLTAFLTALGAASAWAQTPPVQSAPPETQPSQPRMMGGEKMGDGCPMMKKMASLEERLKKLEPSAPKQ